MINQEEHTFLIDKLILKHQCEGLVYVIKVMHIYLLKEIYQSIILQPKVLLQIIRTRKQYLKTALHILTA